MRNCMEIPPWTYSRLEKFETCPKQFYHLKVLKDTEESPTVHTIWGKEVHSAFENFMLRGEPLPEGMRQWTTLAEKVANLPGEKLPEYKLSLSREFVPCQWDSAWTRGIADLLIINKDKAAVLDYKTGKFKPSEQLKLYAVYTLAYHPEVEEVQTGFIWLKEKRITSSRVRREEAPSVWQSMLERVSRLESAYQRDSWPARPSGLCNGWCPVTTCPHNKKRG